MKVYIDEKLYLFQTVDISSDEVDMQDTADEFYAITEICNKFSIKYNLKLSLDSTSFEIFQQKITLDEFDMNEFFFDVMFLFEYEMKYAWIGGEGCDFAIRITPKAE